MPAGSHLAESAGLWEKASSPQTRDVCRPQAGLQELVTGRAWWTFPCSKAGGEAKAELHTAGPGLGPRVFPGSMAPNKSREQLSHGCPTLPDGELEWEATCSCSQCHNDGCQNVGSAPGGGRGRCSLLCQLDSWAG